jgi:selenoprotein W-related protein
VRTVADLLHDYQHVIESLTLRTGSGGVFDVVVDGELLWSKKAAGRHAEPGEVLDAFRARYGEGVPVYQRG